MVSVDKGEWKQFKSNVDIILSSSSSQNVSLEFKDMVIEPHSYKITVEKIPFTLDEVQTVSLKYTPTEGFAPDEGIKFDRIWLYKRSEKGYPMNSHFYCVKSKMKPDVSYSAIQIGPWDDC